MFLLLMLESKTFSLVCDWSAWTDKMFPVIAFVLSNVLSTNVAYFWISSWPDTTQDWQCCPCCQPPTWHSVIRADPDISVPHWMAYTRCHLCIIKASIMVEPLRCAGFCWSKWSKMNFSDKPMENMLSFGILLLLLSCYTLLWRSFKWFPYYVMQYLKPSSNNVGNIFFKEPSPSDISSCCTSVLCKRLDHINRKNLSHIFSKYSLTYLFLSRSMNFTGFPYIHRVCILLCSCRRPQQVGCRERKPHTKINAFKWKVLAQLEAAGIV